MIELEVDGNNCLLFRVIYRVAFKKGSSSIPGACLIKSLVCLAISARCESRAGLSPSCSGRASNETNSSDCVEDEAERWIAELNRRRELAIATGKNCVVYIDDYL